MRNTTLKLDETIYDQILTDQLENVGTLMNMGRDQAAINYCDVAEYSAILDTKTCDLCKHFNGQVFKIDSDLYRKYKPPLHHKCRCILIYIDRREPDRPLPNATEPPSDLVEKHGSLLQPKEVTKAINEQKGLMQVEKAATQAALESKIVPLKELKSMQSMLDVLPTVEKNALKKYQIKENAADINTKLRNGKVPVEAKVLDNIFHVMAPLSKNITVFRGLPITAIKGVQAGMDIEKLIGTSFKDQAFVSTSVSKKISSTFGNAVLEITVPKGKKVIPIGNSLSEAEILLPRGSSFKITNAIQEGLIWIFYCEME